MKKILLALPLLAVILVAGCTQQYPPTAQTSDEIPTGVYRVEDHTLYIQPNSHMDIADMIFVQEKLEELNGQSNQTTWKATFFDYWADIAEDFYCVTPQNQLTRISNICDREITILTTVRYDEIL